MARYIADQYFSVELATLVAGTTVPFDLYVYLPVNNHVILLQKKGDVLEEEFLERYRKKGVTHFHVSQESHGDYVMYLGVGAAPPAARKATKKVEPPKFETPQNVAPNTPEQEISELGFNAEAPEARKATHRTEQKAQNIEPPTPEAEPVPTGSKKSPEEVMSALLKGEAGAKDAAREMVSDIMQGPPKVQHDSFDIFENSMNEHASSVAIYSVLFAMALKQKDRALLQDLVVTSLLHDVGLSQVPPALLSTPQTQLTPAQKQILHEHVILGLRVLKECDYSPSARVAMLLSQHHEKFDGTGFPRGIEGFKVDEMAQVVSLADFIDSICRGRYDGTTRSFKDALGVVAGIERETSFPHYMKPDIFKKIMTWIKDGSGVDYLESATTVVEQTKQNLLKTG